MVWFLIGLALGVLALIATRSILVAVLIFLLNWFISWIIMPVMNPVFYGLPVFLGMNSVILLVYWVFRFEGGDSPTGIVVISSFFLAVAIIWAMVIPFFTTSGIFHAEKYHALIGDVQKGVFSTDTSLVDLTQVRTVDQTLARRLAEKRLGEDTALGSQVNVGIMNIQLVKGQLFWVGPLNHSGFWKWRSNRQGTPGYLMVSATNERDVRLVQEVEESKIYLKYNQGNYWGDALERYLRSHGYLTKGIDDYTFEIDDDGHPYWVVTLFQKQIGFGGKDAVGVVVVDACTGNIEQYSIDKAPTWIDRIQPDSFVTYQLNAWGEYVHGWPNWSNKEKLKVTPGMSLVYAGDHAYWYTGITSVGADEGTVGFVLVDTRTKEASFYKQAGATETAARGSAQGAVQEKGYIATFPILYNVGGVPTYFLTLKDGEGLVKLVAWVSVEDYNIVGIGSNTKEALREYRRSLNSKGNVLAPDGVVESLSTSGKVLRIGKDGDNFYFLIGGISDRLFVGAVDLSPEIVVTKIGDAVEISYYDGGAGIVDMAGFDNLAISIRKTPDQLDVEARDMRVREARSADRTGQNADADWESLSPAEKATLLKGRKE